MVDPSRLTERQKECLRLVYQRFQIKEVAEQLGISPSAVKDHLNVARERLGGLPTSMAAARLLAAREGLADYPPSTASDCPPGTPLDPLPGTPPTKTVREVYPAVPPMPAARVETAPILDDSAAPSAYVAETIKAHLPVPTTGRPINDLTWRWKLLWGLLIAFVSVALVGAFKALLH